MLLRNLNEGKKNSYAIIKFMCILKLKKNRRLKQYSSVQEHQAKKPIL